MCVARHRDTMFMPFVSISMKVEWKLQFCLDSNFIQIEPKACSNLSYCKKTVWAGSGLMKKLRFHLFRMA